LLIQVDWQKKGCASLKQKVALKDKKDLRTEIIGKCNEISNSVENK
jgi:hypothetical protein